MYLAGYGKMNMVHLTIGAPKNPLRAVRTPAHNVIRGLPGLTAIARALGNSPDIRSV